MIKYRLIQYHSRIFVRIQARQASSYKFVVLLYFANVQINFGLSVIHRNSSFALRNHALHL